MARKRVETIDLVQDRAWALLPAKLDDVNAAILARLNGEAPFQDFAAAAEKSAKAQSGARYDVIDGVAVIPIQGTLFKRANLFMAMSGGTSYDLLRADIVDALSRPDVGALLFDIDSPGGDVDGCFDLAAFIRTVRGQKPMIAMADGLMCSAAYCLGCQADAIYLTPSTLMGSIGVISVHYDRSGQDNKMGITRTVIAAGEYKAMGGDHAPLDEKAHEYLNSFVRKYYDMFVGEVAVARPNLSEKDIRGTEAKVYLGSDAVQIGLADAVATFDEAFAKAREKSTMDKTMLKAQHPDTYQAVLEEGKAAAMAETGKTQAAAVAAETQRCAALVGLKGDHAATLAAINDGATPGDFAQAVLAAERKGRAAAAAGIELDAPPAAAGTQKSNAAEPDFDTLVSEHMKAHGDCKKSEAIAAMARKHPAAHEAWLNKAR